MGDATAQHESQASYITNTEAPPMLGIIKNRLQSPFLWAIKEQIHYLLVGHQVSFLHATPKYKLQEEIKSTH